MTGHARNPRCEIRYVSACALDASFDIARKNVLQRGDGLVLPQGREEDLATLVGNLVVTEAGAPSTQPACERDAGVSHRSTFGTLRPRRTAYSRSCRVRFAWMVAPSAMAPASPTLRPKTLCCANLHVHWVWAISLGTIPARSVLLKAYASVTRVALRATALAKVAKLSPSTGLFEMLHGQSQSVAC